MSSKSSTMLEQVQEVIAKQNEHLQKIYASTFTYGIVLGFDKRKAMPDEPDADNYLPTDKSVKPTCIVLHQGRPVEVIWDNAKEKTKLAVGDTVKCIVLQNGIGIIEKCAPSSFGTTVTVKSVIDTQNVEVDFSGNPKIVLSGLFSKDVEKGCRVVLDETGTIVMRNLGKEQGQYVFSSKTGVTWNDIGGLEDVKKQMTEAIEDPIKHKDLFTQYGRKPTKGILLYGPPGNGKTMIGKAVASSISELYKTQESGFIYVKGPEILNMYVGASEEKIRGIFATAREFKTRTGCPAIIFIDEAESILSKRGSGKSSDVDKTIVPQFLTEMDGLDESAAIVILTTNRPDMLDSAVIREGRIDKKIKVPRPTIQSVEMILNLNLKRVPCTLDSKKIAKSAAQLIFDENLCLYNITLKSGGNMKFCLHHIVNGAMIANMVNEAITSAINRDLGKSIKKATGLLLEDVHDSIMSSFAQNARMNHQNHFEDLAYELSTEKNDGIENIQPVKIKEHVRKEKQTAKAVAA